MEKTIILIQGLCVYVYVSVCVCVCKMYQGLSLDLEKLEV